MIISLNYPAKM